jgi:fumarate hydratase class II
VTSALLKSPPASAGVLKHSAQLEHFSIGRDLIPREMITAYATLKKTAAIANHDGNRLDGKRHKLIRRSIQGR